MKKLTACFIAAIAILSLHCHKKIDETATNPALEGYWKLKDTRVSPGTPVIDWTPAPSDDLYVEFAGNNVFKSNAFFFAGYNRYQVVNDSLVQLSAGSGNPLSVQYRFPESLLQLNPTCIEECSYRFKR